MFSSSNTNRNPVSKPGEYMNITEKPSEVKIEAVVKKEGNPTVDNERVQTAVDTARSRLESDTGLHLPAANTTTQGSSLTGSAPISGSSITGSLTGNAGTAGTGTVPGTRQPVSSGPGVAVQANGAGIIDRVKNTASSVATGGAETIEAGIEGVSGTVSQVANTAMAATSQATSTIGNSVNSVTGAVRERTAPIVNRGQELTSYATGTAKNTVSSVIMGGEQTLFEGPKKVLNAASNATTTVKNNVVYGVDSGRSMASNGIARGQELASNLANRVTTTATQVPSTVAGTVGSAARGARETLAVVTRRAPRVPGFSGSTATRPGQTRYNVGENFNRNVVNPLSDTTNSAYEGGREALNSVRPGTGYSSGGSWLPSFRLPRVGGPSSGGVVGNVTHTVGSAAEGGIEVAEFGISTAAGVLTASLSALRTTAWLPFDITKNSAQTIIGAAIAAGQKLVAYVQMIGQSASLGYTGGKTRTFDLLRTLEHRTKHVTYKAADTTRNYATSAYDTTKNYAASATNTVASYGQVGAEKVSNVLTPVKDTAVTAGTTVYGTAAQILEGAKETVVISGSSAANTAAAAANTVKDTAVTATQSARAAAVEGYVAGKETVKAAVEGGKETASALPVVGHQAKQNAAMAVDKTADAAKAAVNTASQPTMRY